MPEQTSMTREQLGRHEFRDESGPRTGREREHEGQQPRELSEQEIDETLEDSFPASDPPAWTSGGAAAVRPGHGREEHVSRDPRPSPPPHRTAPSGDRLSPRRALWDMSQEERQRATVSPSRDDASTDLIGRRAAPEGPHEAMPGAPRGASHREQVGSEGGDALPLHRWSRDALYEEARGLSIKRRSRMSKAELIEAIRVAQQSPSK
jgi:hypothetical protein